MTQLLRGDDSPRIWRSHTARTPHLGRRTVVRRELGYAPRSQRESLADTVQWFLENKRLFARPLATDR
ncbi:MAG: hypothetical protein QMD04_13455 [Anaerolineales bacterium]|nr:hypothetical protein [Anaerolineales bacterium]